MLDRLGWPLSLASFRLARGFATVLLFSGSGLLAAVAFDWLQKMVPVGGTEVAVFAALGLSVYILVLHGVREMLTTRRLQLTAHPLGDFFRAVEISRRAVVLAECRHRLLTVFAVASGTCWGVGGRASVFGVPTSEVVAVVVAPAFTACGALSITVGIAAWSRPDARPRMVVALMAGIAAGYGVAILGWLGSSAIRREPSLHIVGAWGAVVLVIAAAAAVFVMLAVVALRALGRSDFPAGQHGAGSRVGTRVASHRGVTRWLRVILSDLTPSPRARVLSRTFFLTWALGTAAFGLTLMVIAPVGWKVPGIAVDRVVWSVLACAWIATAIVPSDPPRSDGTVAMSISAGLFSTIASVAATAVILAASAVGIGWFGIIVAVLLLGGATWVTGHRILALPSRPLA